jgi:hypothetical protein
MKKILLSLLLTVVFAVPAFSQMDTPMKEQREGHGLMIEMCNPDKMGDMMGTCIDHARMTGLTDDQIMKMKPIHREMQKNRLNSRPT